MSLSIGACQNFIPSLYVENGRNTQVRTVIAAFSSIATGVLTTLGLAFSLARVQMPLGLHKGKWFVIPAVGLGLAYAFATYLDKKFVKSRDLYSTIDSVELSLRSKIPDHSVHGKQLKMLCRLASSQQLKIELLSQMDFVQLHEARKELGSERFKALLPHLASNERGERLWVLLEEIVCKTPEQISQALKELKAKVSAQDLQLFILSLKTILIETKKYDAVKKDLSAEFPFTTTEHVLPSFWVPKAVVDNLKPSVQEIDQSYSASFSRIMDLFDGRISDAAVGHKTDAEMLADWQVDVKFASNVMNAETVKRVALSVTTLPLEYTAENLAAIIETLQSILELDFSGMIVHYKSILLNACITNCSIPQLYRMATLHDDSRQSLLNLLKERLMNEPVQPEWLVIAYEVLDDKAEALFLAHAGKYCPNPLTPEWQAALLKLRQQKNFVKAQGWVDAIVLRNCLKKLPVEEYVPL